MKNSPVDYYVYMEALHPKFPIRASKIKQVIIMLVVTSVFWLSGLSVLAQTSFDKLAPYASYYVDSTRTVSFKSLDKRAMAKFSKEILLSGEYITWIRIDFPSNVISGAYCFESIMDVSIEVFYWQNGLLKVSRNGIEVLPAERSVPEQFRYTCFTIDQEFRTVYLRLSPQDHVESFEMKGELVEKKLVDKIVQQSTRMSFIILGAILIMVSSSVGFFFVVRDRSFLLFGMFLIFFFSMMNKEFLSYLFGDNFSWLMLDPSVNQMFFIICPVSFLLFAQHFLGVNKHSAEWSRIFSITLASSLVCVFTIFMDDLSVNSDLILIYNVAAFAVATSYAHVIYFRYHFKPALYFLLGVAVPMLIIIVIIIDYLNIVSVSALSLLANVSMILFSAIMAIGVVSRFQRATEELVRTRYHTSQTEREAELFRLKNRELLLRNSVIENQTREISAQADRLGEMNIEKDKLLALLAHDLRGPMLNLQAIVSMLSEGIITAEHFSELSAKLKHDIAGASRMIEEVLEWVMSQRHGIKPNPAVFNISEVIAQIVALFEVQAKLKHVSIQFDATATAKVYADIGHVSAIMRNLIQNAIKFSKEHSAVAVLIKKNDFSISITIQDQGIGMDTKQLSEIMERKTIKSTRGTRGEKGTGLGLLLSLEFIESNGGQFSIKSELNAGTKISFTLPKGI